MNHSPWEGVLPAYYVTYFYYGSWAILIGFVAEWLIFKFWLRRSWLRALWASFVVNAISSALGLVLIPLAVVAWGATIGNLLSALRIDEVFGALASLLGANGGPDLLTWVMAWLLVVAVNAVVQYWPLVWFFREEDSWRAFGIVCAANTVGVAFAFIVSHFMVAPVLDL